MLIVLISLVALGLLIGCGEDNSSNVQIDPIAMDELDQPVDTDTGYVATAEAYGRYASKRGGYMVAWVINAGGIIAVPLAIMFLIPGLIFGRWEKVVEGVAMVVFGCFYYWLCQEFKLEDLDMAALFVCIIPGAILFVWGVVNDNERGKFALLGTPTACMAFWLIAQLWYMLTEGLVLYPITTVIVIVVKLFLVAVLFGGRREATA